MEQEDEQEIYGFNENDYGFTMYLLLNHMKQHENNMDFMGVSITWGVPSMAVSQ